MLILYWMCSYKHRARWYSQFQLIFTSTKYYIPVCVTSVSNMQTYIAVRRNISFRNDNLLATCSQVAVTAGQLDCHKLHNAAGCVLVIHDWVVAQQDECVTSIPETPPTSMLKSIIQDCDHEHSSNESGTESYDIEATSPSESCASSYNEDECDSLATPPSPLHTVTFKVMGPTKIPGAQGSKGCSGLRTRQAII